MLKQRVELVNDSNASCLSIACNTAHVLLPKLKKISKVPFVSMIEETVKKVHKDGRKKVGLLSTPSTIKYSLYQDALNKYGIFVIIPSDEQLKILERVIRNVLKNKIIIKDINDLKRIADGYKKKGAEGIILGCTELPLVFPKDYSLSVYNCVEILAMALLRKYYI